MRVSVPEPVTREIASDAARIAKEYMARRGWSQFAINSLMPVSAEGLVGVRTSVKYLHYQNQGTKPRVMWELEGKVIPLPSGPIKATRVGQPGWGYQDRYDKTRYPQTGWVFRQQRWRHPGIDRTGFMNKAVRRAISNARPTLRQRTMEVLMGEVRDE